MICDAARFAFKAHNGQLRKWSERPYFDHLSRVAGRVATFGCEVDVAVSFLHDYIEDCVPFAHWEDRFSCLETAFGNQVATGVRFLTGVTKESMPDLNRAARKELTRARLASAPEWVRAIKLVDRIDNLGELGGDDRFRKLYLAESRELLVCLQGTDSILEDELSSLIYGQV